MRVYKLFSVLVVLNAVQAAKILCLFPSPLLSHLIVAKAILAELARNGHETTMVSYFPLDKTLKNYRDIVIKPSDTMEEFRKWSASSLESKLPMLLKFPRLIKIVLKLNDEAVQSVEFQKIAAAEKFDLLMLGPFMNIYLVGYGAHFNCPIIMFSMAGILSILNEIVGNPAEVSYVPHVLSGMTAPMNFKQRLINIGVSAMELLIGTWTDKRNSDMYTKTFGNLPNFPTYENQKNNISLIFINVHFSQLGIRPLVQNMVEIGGIQIKESPDPLPEDIKVWMESNPNGVIYFSLGSNFKSADLVPEKLQAILKTFGKIKQNVLWKFENDKIDGLPANVMIKKWFPQDDLLTHPNLRLFITHGGLGSVAESKYHAVPLIIIPLFADQVSNADKIVAEGWGIRLDIKLLTEDTLYTAINESVSNPKYKQNVHALSTLYRDRPYTAREAVVFWTNYILRYHGAPHLQSNAKRLNFFQRHSIDTFGFIFVVFFISLYIQLKLFKCLLRFVISKITKYKNKVD